MSKSQHIQRTSLRAPAPLMDWVNAKAAELGISANAYTVLALQEKKAAEASSANTATAAVQNLTTTKGS